MRCANFFGAPALFGYQQKQRAWFFLKKLTPNSPFLFMRTLFSETLKNWMPDLDVAPFNEVFCNGCPLLLLKEYLLGAGTGGLNMDIQKPQETLRALLQSGLKEYEIAQKLQVNKSTVSRWLSGQIKSPSARHYQQFLTVCKEGKSLISHREGPKGQP